MISRALRSQLTFDRWPLPTKIFLRAEVTNPADQVVMFYQWAASRASASRGELSSRSQNAADQSRISGEPRL